MDYSKLGKVELIAKIEELNAEKARVEMELVNMTNVANWFGAVIEAVEKVLVNSPFLSKEGKFFKKLFWVITNFDKIKTLIEEIFATIKLWRDKVEEIKASQNAAK